VRRAEPCVHAQSPARHQPERRRGPWGKQMKIALAFLCALFLANCAGSPVGDALAGPEVLAQRDDAYCRSIGAVPGTQNYMNCRLTVSQNREINHANRFAAAQAGLAAASAASAPQPVIQPTPSILPPPPTRCRSMQVGITVQTVCQ
jgi:hypothetical protein